MPSDEVWDWKKFFTGFFNGKNYAKAIVLGICLFVILLIIVSVHGFISSKLRASAAPTQAIGSNQGVIATKNEDKNGNSYSILNLFNWR